MRNRGVWGVTVMAIAIVRLAFALSASHSVNHSSATAAPPPTDTTRAMADARQHFSQTPDSFRTSGDREVLSSDGTTPEFGDNPAQAMREDSEDDPDGDVLQPAPTPHFVPGQPTMDPTPSRK